MKLPKLMAFAGLAVASVLTLSACVSDIRLAPESPTPTYAPAYAVGQEVPADVAESLNSSDGTLRAYQTVDGRFLVVDKGGALPESVREDMQAQVNAVPVATTVEQSEDVKRQLGAFVDSWEAQTGKRVFIVSNVHQEVLGSGGALPVQRWTYIGKGGVFQPYDFYGVADSAAEYVEELRASTMDTNYELFIHGE